MNIFYPVLKKIIRFFLRFCFKRIYSNKFDELPDNTPILIACNHNNAFADALFVGAYLSKLPMHFITRGDVFNPRMMWFFKLTYQIPIFRFRDGYENMKRNTDTMEACYDILNQNQRIIIFSEGDCVTEKRLRPLQKGTARMAFGAYEKNGQENILIYPVGVNYIEPHSFRSSILLSQGEPLKLSDYLPLYRQNPNKAIRQLTDDLEFQLKKEVLHIDSKEHEKQAQIGFEVLDNYYPPSFFSLAKNHSLFLKMKSWAIHFNKDTREESRTSWPQSLSLLKTILADAKIKTKWPFYSGYFIINIIVAILLLPVGLFAQLYFNIPIVIAKILTIHFKPRREFFLSIRIGITWAIITIWLLLTFLIIGLIWNFGYAALFLLISPIWAKIGLIWWGARNNLIQKIRWSSLDEEDEEKAMNIMTNLQLIHEE